MSYLVAGFLLAIFYLRNRNLSLGEYTLWGLFALLIPALGPFLVILSRPGKRSQPPPNLRGAYPKGRPRRQGRDLFSPRETGEVRGGTKELIQ